MDNTPHNNSIRILTWNANGILANNKLLELTHLLQNKHIDILCLSETHLKPSQKLYIPNFISYRRDRIGSRGGGVAILIRKNIRHKALSPLDSPIESSAIELILQGGSCKVFAVYSPPHKVLQNSDLAPFLSLDGSVVIAGDLNAKHISWGCRSSNQSGRSLLRASLSHSSTIEAPNEPTFTPNNTNIIPDILDLFITKNISTISDPSVLHSLSSDHLPVLLETTSPSRMQESCTKSLDWLLLQFKLDVSS